jgi:hypothetical protein
MSFERHGNQGIRQLDGRSCSDPGEQKALTGPRGAAVFEEDNETQGGLVVTYSFHSARCIAATLALVASPLPGLAAETTLRTVIPVPNATATNGFYYDGSFVDVSRRLYYLGDRSAKGIDIVDIASSKVIAQVAGMFVGQIFNGEKLNNNVSGPNALEIVGTNELWAGDGDSTIKVIDLDTRILIATIPTGGKARTDLVVHDPDHPIVLAIKRTTPRLSSALSIQHPAK